MYLSTASYGREELNDSLTNWYVLAYKFAKFGKWEALVALCEQSPKLAPKGSFSNFSWRQS